MENCLGEITDIRRLKECNFGGLEYLMTRYQVKTTRAALFITRDKTWVEEVVQDVFLCVFYPSRHFDENRFFEPYLMRYISGMRV